MMKPTAIWMGIIGLISLLPICHGVVINPPESPIPSNTIVSAEDALSDAMRSNNVVMGGTFSIDDGETRHGDMVVFGGSGRIDGTLDGSLVVLGGRVTVEGRITGDAVVIGGRLDLNDAARVDGSLVTLGSGVHRADTAVIGEDSVMFSGRDLGIPLEQARENLYKALKAWQLAALTFWSVVAIFVVILLSRHLERTVVEIQRDPLKVLLIGFLFHTCTLAIVLFLFMTVIGIPLSAILMVFWFITCLFGVPAGFALMGRIVLHRFGFRNSTIFLQVILGFIILGGLRFVPYGGGFLIWHIWAMAGIGAAISSKFGTMQPWFSKRAHPLEETPPGPLPAAPGEPEPGSAG